MDTEICNYYGAGKGTRTHSESLKVMHPVCQKPMLGHILDNLKKFRSIRL